MPAIDGLRAVAVLAVFAYHFDHALLPGGFSGVDVFFVISGYVISRSLAASDATSFTAFAVAFYRRRILRIVPALVVFLLCASLAASLFIPDGYLSAANSGTALSAFLGLSNIYLVHSADGYFAFRVPFNPFVHTWSLGVEEQFYLLFPMLFYVWLKGSRAGRPVRWSTWLVLACGAVSLLFSWYETDVSRLSAFYLLPSRFWELAAGAVLFQAQSRRASHPLLANSPRFLPLAALCLAAGLLFADGERFPFPWAMMPAMGTLVIIAGATSAGGSRSAIVRALESPVAVYLGRLSYSIYLWHWVILCLFDWTVGLHHFLPATLAVALSLAVSALSYHLIEVPFRRHAVVLEQPSWRIVALGIAALVVARGVTGWVDQRRNSLGLNLSVTSSYDWAGGWAPPVSARPPGDRETTKHLFVLGDSHALAYTHMVYLAAARVGASVHILGRFDCALANLMNIARPCHGFEEESLAYLHKNARPGDIVFVASLRLPRLSNQAGPFDTAEILSRVSGPAAIEHRRLALLEAGTFVDRLRAMGLHVLLDAPKPIFRAAPFRCADWFNRSNPVCEPGFTMSREWLLRLREPAMTSLRELQKSHGISVWDPFPILCPGPTCSAFNGGEPMFVDGDHLAAYGDRLLVSSFARQLEAIWSKDSPAPL